MEVWEKIKQDLFKWLLIGLAGQLIWSFAPFGKDNSDGKTRSGVRIHLDALTGCEYLGGIKGGLTPRMDANGYQICNKQN